MRHIIDVIDHDGLRSEIEFSVNYIGEFSMVVRNVEDDLGISVILDVQALKELNSLSFKCRKRAEKDLREYNLDGSKKTKKEA